MEKVRAGSDDEEGEKEPERLESMAELPCVDERPAGLLWAVWDAEAGGYRFFCRHLHVRPYFFSHVRTKLNLKLLIQ